MIGVLLAMAQVLVLPELSDVRVSDERLAAEAAADADVIRSLRANGDDPRQSRPVDVRFVGSRSALAKLEEALVGQGWKALQLVALNDGWFALDTEHEQATDDAALLELTTFALKIETVFDVQYDGWGSVAQKGPTR